MQETRYSLTYLGTERGLEITNLYDELLAVLRFGEPVID